MIATKLLQKARPARIGSVDFPKGKGLHFFMGYTKCEHCSANLKIVVDPDEARTIAKAFGYNKAKVKAKFANVVQKWASDV